MLEVRKYYAPNRYLSTNRQQSKNPNAAQSSQQAAKNQRYAIRRLWWLMCANFKPFEDVFLTLTHSNEIQETEARAEIKKFFERVRYHCQKDECPEVKHLLILEKQGRWHHHVVMNNLPHKMLMSLWTCGRIKHYERLQGEETFKELAKYLLSDDKPLKSQRPKHKRRWSGSKNLEKPIISIAEIDREKIDRELPKAPEGYRLLPDWYIGCDSYGCLYQTYTCIRNNR
ncbi:hypothetical protein LJC74_06370 [Eubacteriales bacterium OttesenSCG-928-A19]|nr:hypothetical protein [Eubacteriales bacterium OttesenSCG-928-A19]